MFTAATLLVGGSISGAKVSDVSHILSLFGSTMLLITTCISSQWQIFPKFSIAQLAFVAFFFSLSHIGCYNAIMDAPSGWAMSSSVVWYSFTYFFRIWFRMLFAFSLPTDLILLWTKGYTVSSKKIFGLTSVFSLVVAIVSTIGFAAAGTEKKSIYPCWYRYGSEQINYDLGLLFPELIYGIVVLSIVTFTAPSTNTFKEKVTSSSSTEDVTALVGSVIDEDDEVKDEQMKLKELAKLGITGGFVYRAKLMIGINLVSVIFNILSNRTAISTGMSTNSPILLFLQLINIFVNDGKGFILFLSFITMRTSGWLRLCGNVRKMLRKQIILNLTQGEGAQEGMSTIPLMWKILANQLGTLKMWFQS